MFVKSKNKRFISFKYLAFFVFAFSILTPIGTISHEYGHLFVAKILGYKTSLHYASITYNADVSITNNYHDLLILLGGVSQTILFGTISLLILLIKIKKNNKNIFDFIDWILVFITLFWSREVFNLLTGYFFGIIRQNEVYYSGDEARIANLFDVPSGTLSLPLAIIGVIVICLALNTIPKKIKPTFILGAIIGCPCGFILWMNIIGPILLP